LQGSEQASKSATVIMRTSMSIISLLACLALASGKASKAAGESKEQKGDCSSADAKVAKLTAEVESLRAQLAKGSTCSSTEFSVSDAISKSNSIAGDMVSHLLEQTQYDDKLYSAFSAQMANAEALRVKVVDQIMAHPCSSDFNECIKPITNSDIYKTHIAAHVDTLTKAAQPHVETARPHVDTALKSVKTAYGSAAEMAGVARTHSEVALDHVSTLAGKTPDHLHTVLDPAFVALQKVSPKHHHVLPKKPLDRLLLICIVLFFVYNLWFIPRIAMKLLAFATRLGLFFGIKLPFKVTTTAMSWSFFFGTGFYVCGLCRSRKAADKKAGKGSADAKAEPKKGSKAATEKELVALLDKAKEKGKLSDGVARLADAAKSGKPLQAPEEVKGKEVKKDVLKKALSKYKEVDQKKLGL